MNIVIEAKISMIVDISEDEVENLTEDDVRELLVQELSYGDVDIDEIYWY